MTEQELNERKLVMLRLLNIFSGMDGGGDFLRLKAFTETAEGDAISRVIRNMGSLLDVAGVATQYTLDNPTGE